MSPNPNGSKILLVSANSVLTLDITELVKVAYDSVVGSMDWGSGFLSTEEAAQVGQLGELCGYELRGYEGGDE